MKKLNRIYHHYSLWEEHAHKMWTPRDKAIEEALLLKAIEFTGDAELYGNYMMKVADKWKYSCEHNLTCLEMNRRAWIGHAACCLAIDCPEHITRLAWHSLTQEQQDKANKKADEAIEYWTKKHLEGLCQKEN